MKLGICSHCQQGSLRIYRDDLLSGHYVPNTSVVCQGSNQKAEVVYEDTTGKIDRHLRIDLENAKAFDL